LTIKERLTSIRQARTWEDKIPFHYEYTAGVAGESFLRGLIDGKILGARCENCGITYLPPKMYCTNCFREITIFTDLGLKGRIAALTEAHLDFAGERVEKPYLVGFVTFADATGGIIQRVTGGKARIGSRVVARFKPRKSRTGAISDILSFAVEG
jgi:uncharacterized OB-fold protein